MGSDRRHDEKLEQLKSRYSHKNQNPTMAELLELMADEILQKSIQRSKQLVAKPAESKLTSSNPRYLCLTQTFYVKPLREQHGGFYES
jgi:hypothetical protein